MKRTIFFNLCLCIILGFPPGALCGSNHSGSCQTIIGIDLSSSVPWNTTQDELDFAVEVLSDVVGKSCKKGDKIIIKTFGSFHDRTTSNRSLMIHRVRRQTASKPAIKKKIYYVINSSKKNQNETSILGFLHNLPRLDSKLPICKIFILTDGLEYSEFGAPSDFANGRELPVLRDNYLSGIKVTFIGFGNTLTSTSSKTIAGLERAWKRHFKNSGTQCAFINW